MMLSGCVNTPTYTDLPDEYVRCEHFHDGEIFKYEEHNATKFVDVYCIVDVCIDLYEIIDLNGQQIVLNEHEIRDEWVCGVVEINKTEE